MLGHKGLSLVDVGARKTKSLKSQLGNISWGLYRTRTRGRPRRPCADGGGLFAKQVLAVPCAPAH